MPDTLLLKATKELAAREREMTVKVLHHLREVERRHLFALSGFSSLYEYAVKDLGYSEGAAHRRIASMRLLKSFPQIEKQIESGALPLSTLSQAHTFFRQERIRDKSHQFEILKMLAGKSNREVQRELVDRSTEPARLIPTKLTPLSDTHSKLTIVVDTNLLMQIEELKSLLKPGMDLQELLRFAVNSTIERQKAKPSFAHRRTPALELRKRTAPEINIVGSSSRRIPIPIKRAVWTRDKGRCTYQDPDSGRECNARTGLEFDHVIPFARGGTHSVANLRLRCRTHNTLSAIQQFGREKIAQHIPRLRP